MPLPLIRYTLALAALSTIAACSSKDRAPAADSAAIASPVSAAGADSARMTAAAGGETMGTMHRDTLAARVQAHLGRLATNNPDSLRALVPADREVVTMLIADCEQMMRRMRTDPPRKWRNAVRELRQDLDRLSSMSGTRLQQAMPEHRRRIEGMLAMRHDMMKM